MTATPPPRAQTLWSHQNITWWRARKAIDFRGIPGEGPPRPAVGVGAVVRDNASSLHHADRGRVHLASVHLVILDDHRSAGFHDVGDLRGLTRRLRLCGLVRPPVATTLVLASTAKVQSLPALSVTVRLSAATVLTVPLAVFVESAAKAGETSTTRERAVTRKSGSCELPSKTKTDDEINGALHRSAAGHGGARTWQLESRPVNRSGRSRRETADRSWRRRR